MTAGRKNGRDDGAGSGRTTHRIPRLSEVVVEALGESALLVRFGNRIDSELNHLVHALDASVRSHPAPWLRDCVPAYASLALFYDPDGFDAARDPFEEVSRWVRERMGAMSSTRPTASGRLVEIPVRYGGAAGPDLTDVATHAGLTERDVIARHCQVEYRVALLGFAPGFPYLLGLDPALAMPRLSQPRTQVAAGSVGIGGAQTGIYPRSGPGGWRLIGRTDVVLFDAAREAPSLLQPGDRVRFLPIEAPG